MSSLLHSNKQRSGQTAQHRQKEALEQKRIRKQKHSLSSFKKTKATETSGSIFAETTEQVKRDKYEREVTKIVDCPHGGFGSFSISLVTFESKSLKTYHFLQPIEIKKREVVVQAEQSSLLSSVDNKKETNN